MTGLPPNTRSVNDPDPAGDHDQDVSCLAIITGATPGGPDPGTGTVTVAGTVSTLGLGLKPSGDPTGATDLANITTALAGGYCRLSPTGTYYINATITMPANALLDGGHGMIGTPPAVTAVIKATAGFTGNGMIEFSGTECQVRNLCLDGSAIPSGTHYGVNGVGTTAGYVKLIDLEILGDSTGANTGMVNGIRQNGTGGNPLGWHVERVNVRSVSGSAFLLVSGTDATWIDCQSSKSGSDGWNINGCSNSRFIGCRGDRDLLNGFHVTGSGWGTGAGSGGAVFSACTSDRCTQNGFKIDSTGTGPILLSGCAQRRDGSDGNATRAGILISGATNPVVISGNSVFPGVEDDGTGTNGPALGISVATSTSVTMDNCYIQAVTTAISNGGGNGYFYVGPGVVTATGTTSSPVLANSNALAIQGPNTSTFGSLLSVINTASTASPPVGLIANAVGDQVFGVRVSGDTSSRFRIDGPTTSKCLNWGSGTTSPDTTLYRSAASTLKTDGAFQAAGTLTALGAFASQAGSTSGTHGNPAPTASTTLIMGGFGTTTGWKITPGSSGKVLVIVSGNFKTNTAAVPAVIGARYGTGTAPSSGDAVTGTAIGADQHIRPAGTADGSGWSVHAVLALTPGTAYWVDIAFDTGTAADTAQPQDSMCSLAEIM